jgi:hypothetical protein
MGALNAQIPPLQKAERVAVRRTKHPPFAKPAKDGATPQGLRLRLNFEADGPSGITRCGSGQLWKILLSAKGCATRHSYQPDCTGGLKINKFHYIEDNTYTKVAGFFCKQSK